MTIVEDDGFTLASIGRRRKKYFKACANVSTASTSGVETASPNGCEEMPLERLESKMKRVRDNFPAEYK